MSDAEEADIPQDNEKPKKFVFSGEPWERQEHVGESLKAFEAFALYRDQGSKRSTARVARELGKSKGLMDRWSSNWQWVRRVEEFEKNEERLYQAARHEQRRKMAERHAKTGELLQTAALTAMRKHYGQNFELVTPEMLKSGDMLKFIVEGAKLERIALGEPADIVEQQHTGGTPDNDRKPFIPLTHVGRIDDALALLEAARARAADESTRAAD